MVSCICIIHLRKSIPWIGILVTFSLLSAFSGYGFFFSITITSFILTFSTIFFIFSKQKTVLIDEPKEGEEEVGVISDGSTDDDQLQESPAAGMMCSTTATEQPKIETFSQEKTVREDCSTVRSRDLLNLESDRSNSDDQSYSSSYQDSDDMDLVDDQSPTDCSDDSISDEESLIEIALPSGIYVGSPKHHEEDHHHHHHDPKFFKQQKFPAPPVVAEAADDNIDQSLLFHHHQASFMELLAEINDMNEEENLIEIDLSMGSIKCSRFQIQA